MPENLSPLQPEQKPKSGGKAETPTLVPAAAPGSRGTTPSFLTEKSGELNEAVQITPSQKKEEYIQPDAEKETGGES